MYLVGYKFGPEHSEIHWLWNERGKTYQGTFSTEKKHAKPFSDKEHALNVIIRKLKGAAPDRYHYCPVLEDTETGARETIVTFKE